MDERIRKLIEQQTQWQQSRKDLSWEEKIRMVAAVKDELARLLPAYRRQSDDTRRTTSSGSERS